ncbi:Gfo/Idh/MocA family oxidoreductase [Marispirochaeta aestuarii]|uniref:Gfo/Idh/MocA family protein n=1 Tax=Marispirochaeta aestuarii TaxID=1963862 RepID=UPI0029C6E730|nr:Gfo/Idh/MocA family oxidoreductase [Marispirochaeta aestuarii]
MIPCAIIGLGRIASLLEDDTKREKPASHAGAVSAHPETFIAAGMDSDPERRELFSRRWGDVPVYDDPRRMLQDSSPEILHICTHADSHLDYLALALEYRIPVVVLEKPVSDSLGRAKRMLKRLQRSSTRVLVNHERRYSRDYLAARECIRSMRYGPVRSVNARLFMGRNRPLEAVLLYDGTHLFDIISFLLAEPIRGIRRLPGIPPGSSSLFAGARCGTVPVCVEVGNHRDHVVFELEFSFEEGRLRIGNGVYEEFESRESPWYDEMRSLIPVETELPEKTGYFSGMFEDAVRLAKDPGAVPLSSYADGLESLRIVELIRRRMRFTSFWR